MRVPLFDTATPLEPLRQRLKDAMLGVLDDGRYVLGPDVEAFEREFAAYLGVEHVIGVANGTDALTIALRAAGVGPGDEVVVPSFTFYASAEAIPPTGAKPVFCDVDFDTRNVTVESVRAVLTSRTKAVVAVDLFGYPAPVSQLREELDVVVIEDAAQAAGASIDGVRAGALGTAATFSFFPSKNLGGFGDGGAIATDDERIAEQARMLGFHGSRDKSTFEQVGYNSRLDSIQAAGLRVLLPHLDEWTQGRQAAASAYARSGLGELVELPTVAANVQPAWHLYVISHPSAPSLQETLGQSGVQARGYYRTPIHRQPAMALWGDGVELPVTEELARRNLALPISPVLSHEQVSAVTEAVAAALARSPA